MRSNINKKATSRYFVVKSITFPYFQLQENLADYISSNITLAWDHVGFLCHSSGCEEFLTLFETFDDPTFAKVKMRHLQMLLLVQYLPPANEVWGKVMFLQVSVILFTGGGGWLPARITGHMTTRGLDRPPPHLN